MNKKNQKILLIFILLLGLVIRFFGINWDQGFHLHPDERMLIMVATRLNFFNQLNPDFFNYGSLPIYILKGITQFSDLIFKTQISNYDGMLYAGRFISILLDVLTIYLVFKISALVFNKKRDEGKISILAAFVYTIAFFPIQNSHFFVVDVFLNFLLTFLVYQLISFSKKPSYWKTFGIACTFAACVATKFTPIIFLPFIFALLFFSLFKKRSWIKKLVLNVILFIPSFLVLYFLFMPFAFIKATDFIRDISMQLKMNGDPYIFPYTLQYVATVPYFYYLKNIFLWGLGPILSILSFIGAIIYVRQISKNRNNIIFILFYLYYFLIIGRSAVKFMRYMLPLYPFLAIMAGMAIVSLKNKLKFGKIIYAIILVLICFWTSLFLNIYSQTHTRIEATNWIINNVAYGKTIAVEHWDDSIPLVGGENYSHEELTLYDQPDNEYKWEVLNNKLKKTDYIVIASNRLYIPLQKLNDCSKFKSCYPLTSKYYKELFGEKLSFKKVAEFSHYPELQIGGWKLEIKDDSADESFTVYDHPKIMIFKNEK